MGLDRVLAATYSLGAGHQFRRYILGDEWPLWATLLELAPAAGLLAWSALRAWATRATPAGRRLATVVMSAATMSLLLYGRPREAWAHHWVVTTPLLALAAVLAIGRQASGSPASRGLAAARVTMAAWLADERRRWARWRRHSLQDTHPTDGTRC